MAGMFDINLLKKKRGISERQFVLERKMFVWSVVGLVLVVVVTIAFFLLQFFTTRKLNTTLAEVDRLKSEFAGLQNANNRQLYLKNRLKLVADFFDSRVQDREALQRIFSLDIPGVVVLGAAFESDEMMTIRLQADTVLALDQAYAHFEDESFFTQVVNRGVARAENGSYSMQLELLIPVEGSS